MNNTLVQKTCLHESLIALADRFKELLPEATEILDKWIEQNLDEQGIAKNEPDYFQEFLLENGLNTQQQILLTAAVVAYAYPTFYYTVAGCSANNNSVAIYNDRNTGICYPTLQTVLFILYGRNYQSHLAHTAPLLSDKLFKGCVLETVGLPDSLIKNNPLNHVVSISDDYLAYFTTGEYGSPKFSASFPAHKVTTNLGWNDLVLDDDTKEQLEEITTWRKHHSLLFSKWELSKVLRPGYRALFYGPSGTGKTLSASILGNELGMDVYRIDLSMVVSKYIGETEKNLSTLFDRAMNKNWILFFDEADSLFGTRTNVKDSHDKYANQEVSYLLQRIEEYEGIIILATNLKGNIDKAFSRRFQNMVRFKTPNYEQRKQLWQNSFSKHTVPETGLIIDEVAKNYELTGGTIINVVQYASLKAAQRGDNIILYKDVKTGISREMQKDGKTV